MNRIFLSLLVVILFCGTGKAYAVDRVVIRSITVDNPDKWVENIYLIADKYGADYKNFTVQVGDFGRGLYNFPDWYHYSYEPKLYKEDLNGDKLEDILIELVTGSGSSVSTKAIHILHQGYTGFYDFQEVPVEPIQDAIKRLVKMEQKGNEITISIGKKKYVVDYPKFGYYTSVDRPGFGSIEGYEPKSGILYGTTNDFVTIPEAYIGGLTVKYAWDGKMYKAESVTFEAAPYKPSRTY
ncbi:MAG TPA: hypothetical protein VK190_11875 [Pseudoneobacillus sp.]|nr:hypothetical protein [Pseudoneobacillus sp.]